MTLAPRNLKMTVTYDGSAFSGFQFQPSAPTVQSELERACRGVLGKRVRVVGSGRTDTGVHALGQVVTVKTVCPIPVDKLILALNRSLPEAIRISFIEEAPLDFHARFSAKGKHYRYLIQPVREFSPFLARFVCQVEKPLFFDRLQEGAARFVGTHDFAAFTRSPNQKGNTSREMFTSEISRLGEVFAFDIVGSGFLHNMVRNMAKALILIGTREMEPVEIEELYRNQNRRRLGAPAPAAGLYLMKVWY